MMNFQPFDQSGKIIGAVQQNGHGNQGAQMCWYALPKIKAGQWFGRHTARDDCGNDGSPKINRNSTAGDPKDQKGDRTSPRRAHQQQGKGKDCQSDSSNRYQIAG